MGNYRLCYNDKPAGITPLNESTGQHPSPIRRVRDVSSLSIRVRSKNSRVGQLGGWETLMGYCTSFLQFL